jgi:hypothetical protein
LNRKFIQYNLEEIQEEVENTLKGIKRGDDYTQQDFYRAIQHIVHHVNIAWNARNATQVEVDEGDLTRWSQYPTDLRLI